ncbi:MAG TPA: NAD(P)H-dependent oxidoreductase subunit E [Limnochordales bacterium]
MTTTTTAPTGPNAAGAGRPLLWRRSAPDRPSIIPLLQAIQEEVGYLPRERVVQAAAACGMGVTQAYAVASFYNFFRLTPPGRHTIRICRGTACHVRGSAALLEHVQQMLGVRDGGTTDDGEFSLETVACLGCCSRAPVVVLDGAIHGRVGRAELTRLIRRVRESEGVRQEALRERTGR